jgi:hypothetical protein
MIKKFFAKLTSSWDRREQPSWDKARDELQAVKGAQDSLREAEMAKERQEARLRVVPDEERLRRLKEDVETTVETRDRAA